MDSYKHSLVVRAFTILSLLFAITGFAGEFPATVKFEGSLPDGKGKAYSGPATMVFSLYTTETGGAAIWQEIQNIDIDNNKFTVNLGTTTALNFQDFNALLYLGFAVDGQPEVTPRQQLPLSSYAVRAMDADTVGGKDPAVLDQSAHVNDTNNPHNVTAEQLGIQTVQPGTAVYSCTASYVGKKDITFVSTCTTIPWDSCSFSCGSRSYYDCDGNQTSSPTPYECPAVVRGYLVSP